jgi:hypothetical protein
MIFPGMSFWSALRMFLSLPALPVQRCPTCGQVLP